MRRSFPSARRTESVPQTDYDRVHELLWRGISRAPGKASETGPAFGRCSAKKVDREPELSSLSALELRILDLLAGWDHLTPSFLVEHLGTSSATVRRRIRGLREMDLVEVLGQTSSVRYRATERGRRILEQEGISR